MIDLRSDTVTLPTAQMWEAMNKASLKDNTLEGDPTVIELEEAAARLAGKEAGLFVCSGTMGNLIACLVNSSAGDELITDKDAHIVNSENNGLSTLGNLRCKTISSFRGEMDLEELGAYMAPAVGKAPIALVCMESSHNFSGGYVPSLPYMSSLYSLAQAHNIAVHTDGARIFNAASYLAVELKDLAQYTDSLALCLSKGLSAPFGSVLVASAEFIEKARFYRKMLGGGLRQGGIMAAAGLIALNTMTDRLSSDHDVMRQLWRLLNKLDHTLVDETEPHTNILRLRVSAANRRVTTQWKTNLEQLGVLVRVCDDSSLRLVSHRHVSIDDVAPVFKAIKTVYLSMLSKNRT